MTPATNRVAHPSLFHREGWVIPATREPSLSPPIPKLSHRAIPQNRKKHTFRLRKNPVLLKGTASAVPQVFCLQWALAPEVRFFFGRHLFLSHLAAEVCIQLRAKSAFPQLFAEKIEPKPICFQRHFLFFPVFCPKIACQAPD
jgi:hypothetical protein